MSRPRAGCSAVHHEGREARLPKETKFTKKPFDPLACVAGRRGRGSNGIRELRAFVWRVSAPSVVIPVGSVFVFVNSVVKTR